MSLQNSLKATKNEERRGFCRISCILGSLGLGTAAFLCCLLYVDFTIAKTSVKKIHLLAHNKDGQSREATLKQRSNTLPAELNQSRFAARKITAFESTDYVPVKLPSARIFDPALARAINHEIQPPLQETFDCDKLFKGEAEETQRAMSFQKRTQYRPPSSSEIIQATTSCDAFKHARGYRLNSTLYETEFPLAFSILVHKSVEQFERLLRAIFRPTNYYCVHIDRKSKPYIHNAIKAIVRCFDNVFISTRLEEVVYTGYTRLQADINCMKDLYDLHTDWKYIMNLAGSEFPLLPNNQLVYILKLLNGTNIVERHMATDNPWRYERKFKTVLSNGSRPGRLIKVSETNAPPPYNLVATKCSAYGAFSRQFVRYVLYNPVAQALLNWSKTTYSPDEIFWGTLNNLHANRQLGTPGGDQSNVDNHLARAVMWKSPACHGRNVHIICIFGAGDLPWLKGSYQLFANKFGLDVDQVALQCMEQLLSKREKHERPRKINRFIEYARLANGSRSSH